jgi:subtilisin family serine protease
METKTDDALIDFGVTGKGVTVAILDRGISWQHPDFINSAKASAANGKSNNPNTFVNLSVFIAMLSVVTQFLGLGLANSSVINGGVAHHFQELCSSL